jgi:LysM repeat protein
MQGMREFSNALVVTLLSIGLVMGALSISLVEFIPEASPTGTFAPIPNSELLTATPSPIPTATLEPGVDTPIPALLTATNTVIAPASCPPPGGWLPIRIQTGETLDNLAAKYGSTKEAMRTGNCLISDNLIPGTLFYVPSAPTSTVRACSRGAAGWVETYKVKPGDTLYSIAVNHGTSVNLMRTVNCRAGDVIFVGEMLYVPNVPTRTPAPSPLPGITASPYPTDPLTETALPFTATVESSDTPPPTDAPTDTPVPTPTASPTAFPTP